MRCGKTAACPDATSSTRKNQSIAPSIAPRAGHADARHAAAQITRQDNVPDYGIPGSAWPEYQLAPTTVIADRAGRLAQFLRQRRLRLRQGRAGKLHRPRRARHQQQSDAEKSDPLQPDASRRRSFPRRSRRRASCPRRRRVTVARQGNERENEILSNQTSLSARFATGRMRHAANAGIEIASEEQFAPTLGGVGTRNPAQVSIYNPNPFDPVTGYAPERTPGVQPRKDEHASACMRSTPSSSAHDGSSAAGCGGSTTTRRSRWPMRHGALTTDLHDERRSVQRQGGRAVPADRCRQRLLSRTARRVTPPGTANFTLSAQPNNQNNPNVKPQESRNYEVGGKIGFYDNRLSLSAAVFRTDNKNVIFTVDATAIPPVFNQDDGQRVNGFTIGVARADHAALAGAREFRLPRHAADQPEPGEQRQAADADAGVVGQPVDDLRVPESG